MTGSNIHATAISISGSAVVLLGKSGAGKSDLALRLIDRGATLISDDRVEVFEKDAQLWSRAIPNISGKFEIRGIGIIELPYIETAQVRLVANLDKAPERFPDPWPTHVVFGFAVPAICLDAREPSAPLKIEQALKWLLDRGTQPVRQAEIEE